MLNKKINPLDFDADIAIGVGLPFNSANNGFKLNYTTEEQIHSNFRNLILTRRGERVMHPTFGSLLYDLLFEPRTDGHFDVQAKEAVVKTTSEWMPFIKIKYVDIEYDNNTAFISIGYEVKELDISNVLDVTVKV